MLKIAARASRNCTSESGSNIGNDMSHKNSFEYMDTTDNASMIRALKKPGNGLGKMEKRIKMSKTKKKIIEKAIIAHEAKCERMDLIKKLASNASEVPVELLTSSKNLGSRKLSKRRRK